MISAEKKRHLIHVYLTQGFNAAKPLAIEYGISPKTITKYTRALGIKGKHGRENGFRCDKSPMWERAIERGSVVA